jgi:hypothetical protein
MLSNQEKRIQSEIQLFQEAYPDSNILREKLQIVIENPDLKCILNLHDNWPFYPPQIMIKYHNHLWGLKIGRNDWSGAMDFRTVYAMILDSIENNFVYNEQVKILEEMIPGAEILYHYVCNYVNVKYNGLEINIPTKGSENITVIECDQSWPQNMIPENDFNLPQIVSKILGNQKMKLDPDEYIMKLKCSLESKFDDVTYSRVHHTFTVNSSLGLIIVGITPDISYLPPNIIIFKKGMIVSNQFELSNWKRDSDLAQIILDAKIIV